MIFRVACFCSIVTLAVVNCEPPSAQYGTPTGSYGTPNYNTHHHDHDYNSEPKSYEFGYQVKDDYSGNNYKRQEASDGNQVKGEYRVQLPDGRVQIVTYHADWQTGFHADVRYEGTAAYPEHYGNGAGGPSNQYGVPGFGGAHNFDGPQHGQGYAGNYNGLNSPATSSVSIKDFSGPGTPYQTGYNGGYNYGNNYNNVGYDTYANAGNYANNKRPGAEYGAP